jgi:hypothetical protein
MNIVKKRPARIDFTAKEEPEPQPVVEKPKETENSVTKTIEEVEPKVQLEVKSDDIFNMGKESIIPPSKKKKKRVLSQKQLDHLARCREKALEKKRAMRQFKDKEKAEKAKIKAEKKAEREAKSLKKKEDDKRIREAQLEAKKKNDDDAFYARMDRWYERKQARKTAARAKKKPPTASGIAKPKATAPKPKATAPKQTTSGITYRNEWKDPLCNSKFSPFNSTFQRKTRRRGYMNY